MRSTDASSGRASFGGSNGSARPSRLFTRHTSRASAHSSGALLTGAKLNSGTFIGNDGSSAGWAKGKSIDQELVAMIGQTSVPSLQLGVNAQERDVSGVMSYGGRVG